MNLTKKELAEIRARFEAGKADRPLRIEGEHIKYNDGFPIDLGWSVMSAEGHGIPSPYLEGQKEMPIRYASHTTFEAATFLVHLPLDMGRLLSDLENVHRIFEDLVGGDEGKETAAKNWIRYLLGKKREE